MGVYNTSHPKQTNQNMASPRVETYPLTLAGEAKSMPPLRMVLVREEYPPDHCGSKVVFSVHVKGSEEEYRGVCLFGFTTTKTGTTFLSFNQDLNIQEAFDKSACWEQLRRAETLYLTKYRLSSAGCNNKSVGTAGSFSISASDSNATLSVEFGFCHVAKEHKTPALDLLRLDQAIQHLESLQALGLSVLYGEESSTPFKAPGEESEMQKRLRTLRKRLVSLAAVSQEVAVEETAGEAGDEENKKEETKKTKKQRTADGRA